MLRVVKFKDAHVPTFVWYNINLSMLNLMHCKMRADVHQSSENVNDHVFLNRGGIWPGLVNQLLSGSSVDMFDKICLTEMTAPATDIVLGHSPRFSKLCRHVQNDIMFNVFLTSWTS